MHTILVMGAGFVLLGLCLLASCWFGGATTAALVTGAQVFIPLWCVAALFNMWMGVSRAGYSTAQELPFFLLVFSVPAAGAAFIWWKYA